MKITAQNKEKGYVAHLPMLVVAGVVVSALALLLTSPKNSPFTSVLGDNSENSTEQSGDDDKSSDEDDDNKDEASSNDTDDKSTDEPSTNEDDAVSTDEPSVADPNDTSIDEPSIDEPSVDETDDVSTPSEPGTGEQSTDVDQVSTQEDDISEPSTEDEVSVSDFEVVQQINPNVALVSNKERLFFLLPVNIEKTLELDANGNVVGVKQSFFSKLLEWLSF